MFIEILKSKLKEVIVTDSNVKYEGSITLDPDLMDAAELKPYERVEVNAVDGHARIVTYVLPGKRGTGQVEMNGGAANFFIKSDRIHVNCFAIIDENDILLETYPTVVKTDEDNKIIK